MTISFFIINEKIENTKISSMLPNYVFFFFILGFASVNAIFTTVTTVISFKFILTKYQCCKYHSLVYAESFKTWSV